MLRLPVALAGSRDHLPTKEAVEMTVSGKPATPVDRDAAETKASAMLYQAVWEASQFKSPDAIRDYVEMTLREIERDEP